MKNKILLEVMTFGLLLSTSTVYARNFGNATVEFTGNDKIMIGEIFTIKMNVTEVTDTNDGIVSLGGNLSFDPKKIEYISSEEVDAPYQFQINEAYNYKLAGLDFTLDNGIKNTVTVLEFTFKALEEGSTTITLENYKLTDSQNYVDTTVNAKTIKIEKKETKEDVIGTTIPPIHKVNNNQFTIEQIPEEVQEIKEENKELTGTIKPQKKIKKEKETAKIEENIHTKIHKLFREMLDEFKKIF